MLYIDRGFALPASEAAKSGIRPDQVQIQEKYGGGFPANVEGLHHLHCLVSILSIFSNSCPYHNSSNAYLSCRILFGNHYITIMTITMPKAKEHLWTRITLSNTTSVRIPSHPHPLLYPISPSLFHLPSLSSPNTQLTSFLPKAHCLDIVRQQLMCTIDTGALGQVWWDTSSPKAFVDFNTVHQCKNFDAIRQWAFENQMPEHVPKDFIRPPREGDLVYEEIPWYIYILA